MTRLVSHPNSDALHRKAHTEISGSAASRRIVEWKTTTSITTLLPDDVPRLPSFFSTLVSRRYAFDVQIVLSKLGVSHKPMHLRVPVQMVYSRIGKCPDGPPEVVFEDDLKAPAYVP
jgi:hypothetical protein